MAQRWWVLLIVSAALFLVVIDMTVLYTALPTLAQALHTTTSEKLWILNAYALVMAGLMPVFGALGDRYGQRRIFVFGLVSFGLASSLAAFSTSAEMLIAARALLAVGGAAMIPATIAIVRLTFSDPKEQALAIGIWASIASGGAAVGPVLGGFLLEHFWWGSVFLINVPVIVLALLGTWRTVSNYPGHSQNPIDFLSCVLIMLGMISLVSGIKEFAQPTPQLVVAAAALAVGTLSLTLFAKRQLRLPFPLVDLQILKTAAIASGIMVALIVALTLIGFELALSQRLQLVLEKSPLEAGLYILPVSLGSFCAGPIAGLLIARMGTYRVLLTGLLLTIMGIGGYLMWRDSSALAQIFTLAIAGIGLGSSLTASSSLIMSHVSEERAGMAGSLEGMAYEVGGALGVTLFGSLMSAIYLASLRGTAFAEAAGDSLDHAHTMAAAGADDKLLSMAKAAFENGFYATGIGTCLGLLILVCWLARRNR